MTPRAFLTRIINPTLDMMQELTAVAIPASDQARVELLTIALQESGLRYRQQVPVPYAHGWWEFENGPQSALGGLFKIMPQKLSAVCAELVVPFDRDTVFGAIVWCDLLACAVARLLLWSEPNPLPAIGDIQGAWNYYVKLWGPGSPRPKEWPALYAQSVIALKGLP